jgi:periplasmic divalent cation tolerance protein
MIDDLIVVLVTAKDKSEAEKISQTLLEAKLIACANIVSPVVSFFFWKSKLDKTDECLIIMKSRLNLFTQLLQQVKALHSYDVPEVLALPVVLGSEDYLAWMQGALKP